MIEQEIRYGTHEAFVRKILTSRCHSGLLLQEKDKKVNRNTGSDCSPQELWLMLDIMQRSSVQHVAEVNRQSTCPTVHESTPLTFLMSF